MALLCCVGAGTFGTVRAGIYKPRNGGPEVECAIKVLKPAEELGNQKVVCVCVSVYVCVCVCACTCVCACVCEYEGNGCVCV